MVQLKKRKARMHVFIRQIFQDDLIFFLYMVFVYAIFRKVSGAYAVAAIQRSLLKQAFLESRQNP